MEISLADAFGSPPVEDSGGRLPSLESKGWSTCGPCVEGGLPVFYV